jgi:hypothetical protein
VLRFEATLIGSLRARAGFWDDHEGEVLDMLVQRRRDSRAALRLTRKLRLPRFSGRFVKKQGFPPKLQERLDAPPSPGTQ